MAVNVKVNPTDQIGVDIGADSVHVNVTPPDVSVKIHKPIVSRFKLEARETLSGDILIFDHKDIDIIIIKHIKCLQKHTIVLYVVKHLIKALGNQ